MTLTQDFKETLDELCKDTLYREALIEEAKEAYLEGDTVTGDKLSALAKGETL